MSFSDAIATNLLSPAVLFFLLGLLASVLKSDLKLPEALYVTLTIYLLAAIGLKGGAAISQVGLASVARPLFVCALLSAAIPLWVFPLLRAVLRLEGSDAAAVAAHYGSVSAMTFIAATGYLQAIDVPFEPETTAFLAVMEAPAILVAVLLGKMSERGDGSLRGELSVAVKEALLGRSVFLLVGALLIGMACGKKGLEPIEPFFVAPFQGVLALFLLEMGLVAGTRLSDLRRVGVGLFVFAIAAPVVHGALGVAVGEWLGLSLGGSTLLGVLAGSASYIAAPAAVRLSLPKANPTISLTAALAITFPFNVALGIPLYHEFAVWLRGGS